MNSISRISNYDAAIYIYIYNFNSNSNHGMLQYVYVTSFAHVGKLKPSSGNGSFTAHL